jgi:hypothetical protein
MDIDAIHMVVHRKPLIDPGIGELGEDVALDHIVEWRALDGGSAYFDAIHIDAGFAMVRLNVDCDFDQAITVQEFLHHPVGLPAARFVQFQEIDVG